MERSSRVIRIIALVICELTVIYTLITVIKNGDMAKILPALGTGVLVFLPKAIEYLFGCRFGTLLFTTSTLYTVGPMLGHCLKLYHIIPYWDKLLHFYGGIAFALFGWFLFGYIQKGNGKRVACALFALFFSVTLSVFWEFVEFGVDMLFDKDMMDDTVITRLDSYLLGEDVGVMGHIEEIHSVTADEKAFPVDGYIDIGLIDTMTDMLIETAGALFAVVICCINKKYVGIEKI